MGCTLTPGERLHITLNTDRHGAHWNAVRPTLPNSCMLFGESGLKATFPPAIVADRRAVGAKAHPQQRSACLQSTQDIVNRPGQKAICMCVCRVQCIYVCMYVFTYVCIHVFLTEAPQRTPCQYWTGAASPSSGPTPTDSTTRDVTSVRRRRSYMIGYNIM